MQGMLGAMQGMMGMTGAASGAAAGGKGAVLVRGFDFGTTPEQINAHMSRAGTVEDVQFVDQGTACVTYSSATEAQVAVVHLQQTIIAGNTRYLDVTLLDPAVFFEGYNIDAEQMKKFYAMSLPQQQAVMAQGSLATARDPTSVLIGRMKKVKAEMAAKSAAGGAVPGGKGCVYVRGFDFATTDEQLAIHMSTVGTVTKVQKIDDGSACVTYSSVEEANLAVQQLQHTTIAGTGSSRYLDLHSMDPEQFLAGHSVDQNIAAQFLGLPHERQQYIIGKGSLATARDPTAVLIQRMKQGKGAAAGMGFAGGGMGGMGGMGMGSGAPTAGAGSVIVRGFDYGTTDEQIVAHMTQVGPVQNIQWVDDASRSITYSTSEEAQAAAAHLQKSLIAGNRRYIDVMLMDPVAFLAEHTIGADQQMEFLQMTPEQQYHVISKGSLATARDPTAVLINRMKGARDAGKGGSFGPITGKGGMGGCGKGPYSGGPGKGGGLGGDKERKLEMLLKLVEAMGGSSW